MQGKKGERVIITGTKHYKGRTGIITKTIGYNNEMLYSVKLDNFNDICLTFRESEIKILN